MKQRDDQGVDAASIPDAVRASIPPMRDRLRAHADLMDEAAHLATDGGPFQSALRAVATELRSCSDVMEESLIAPVTDQRQMMDVMAALLLSQAIHVGSHRWPDLADQVRAAARTQKG